MRNIEFERELQKRLEENRRLMEHPYLPERVFGVAAFVGRHLFIVILGMAGMLATITMTRFAEQIKWVNAVMLFLE